MTGMNVLSDSLKGGSADKASSQKGVNAKNSLGNVTGDFAVLLSALTNFNANPIGQNPGDGQEQGDEKDLDSFGENSRLGYWGLSFLSQPLIMGDPAGKEANSGNGVNQGTRGSFSTTNIKQRVDELLSMLSLDSKEVVLTKGLPSELSQGNNPGITELDKYRAVITNLLEELSGQITMSSSPEDVSFVSENGTSKFPEMLKLTQTSTQTMAVQGNNGQMTEAAEKEMKPYPAKGEIMIEDNYQTVPKKKQDMATGTDERPLDQIQSDKFQFEKPFSTGQSAAINRETDVNFVKDRLQEPSMVDDQLKSKLQVLVKPLEELLKKEQAVDSQELQGKIDSLLAALNQVKNQSQGTRIPQEALTVMDPSESGHFEGANGQLQGIGHSLPVTDEADNGAENKDTMKNSGDKSTEASEVKTTQSQNPNLGIGFSGNISTSNEINGKAISVPVWAQVSNVVKEQILSHPDQPKELKDLDIKLHPAELGRIHIGMRIENGQVHMMMHASEAATGQLLQNQLSDLRNTLMSQGVNCGMLEMGYQGGDQQQNPHHQRGHFQGSGNTFFEHNEDEDTIPVIQGPSSGGQLNRINVTA